MITSAGVGGIESLISWGGALLLFGVSKVRPTLLGLRFCGVGGLTKDGDASGAADRALQFSRVGRRIKVEGRAEQVIAGQGAGPRPAWLDSRGPALQTATYETARLRHPGYDIYFVEGEWRRWSEAKEPPHNPDRAFLAFFRSYAEKHPI